MGTDSLSPPGSSTYKSSTLYVGDGTWDASKNDFLLPNLVGLNYDTMRYNGMGNRFSSLPEYYTLVLAHGIIAAIVFLLIVPTAIMVKRFYAGRPGAAVKIHIYLNILTVLLVTVVFTLGWFAVGPSRSLTNPHHGIGLAIFVLVLVQAIGGAWAHSTRRRRQRRITVKGMLHHWLGRTIALLGLAQIPLGLTLYGSPLYLFILYALWVFFLVVLYFVLSYRASDVVFEYDHGTRTSSHGGTVVSDKRRAGIGSILAPLAAGAGLAALLGRRRDKDGPRSGSRSGSRSRSHVSRTSRTSRTEEVIPSRHGSRHGSRRGGSRRDSEGSFIEEEREKRTQRRSSGGLVDTALKVGAVAGTIGLAKAWWERNRGGRKTPTIRDDEYSSVAMDTPSRQPRRPRETHTDSALSEDTESDLRTLEARNQRRPILPGPSVVRPFTPLARPVTPPNPAVAAAAISAADRPINRPAASRVRSDSYDSYDDDSLSSPGITPRRKTGGHTLRDGIAAAGLFAGIGSYFKNRREKKEQARIDEIRRVEEEKVTRQSSRRYTGDGHQPPRRGDYNESSLLSSEFTESVIEDPRRPHFGGPMPPLAAALGGTAGAQSRSRQEMSQQSRNPSNPPLESGSEALNSPGDRSHRRHSSTTRRAEEAAAAVAAGIAAEEVSAHRHARRERSASGAGAGGHRRSQSRSRDARQEGLGSPPVSVRIQMHGDNNRNVTLRRLSEAEAAAEREVSQNRRKLRKGGSSDISSMSGTDFSTDHLAQKRRYRRDESDRLDAEERRRIEREAERKVEAADNVSTISELSPPNPAFAKGKKRRPSVPKDSPYYSGNTGFSNKLGQGLAPMTPGVNSGVGRGGVVESPESADRSHGTWSGITPAPGSRPNTGGSRPGTSGGPGATKENLVAGSAMTGTGVGSEENVEERRRRRRAERSATGGGRTVEFE